MFKRKIPLTSLQKLRDWIYPRMGIMRAIGYLGHRLRRLPDSPHRISIGLGLGVFISFTPLFGLHFLVAAFLAWLVRANAWAAILGTFMGNPATFPLIAGISLWFGRNVYGLGPGDGERLDFESVVMAFSKAFSGAWTALKSLFIEVEAPLALLREFASDIFIPYLVGGLLPGLVLASVTYFIALPVVQAYQLRRRMRFVRKASDVTKTAFKSRSEG